MTLAEMLRKLYSGSLSRIISWSEFLKSVPVVNSSF
jgi:hypothetical protein